MAGKVGEGRTRVVICRKWELQILLIKEMIFGCRQRGKKQKRKEGKKKRRKEEEWRGKEREITENFPLVFFWWVGKKKKRGNCLWGGARVDCCTLQF